MVTTSDTDNICGFEQSAIADWDQVAPLALPTYFSPWASNTPYRSYQWYLDGYLTPNSNINGANIDRISADYSGAGVKVGMIDNGFDSSNVDLTGRIDLQLSYDPRDTGPSDIKPEDPAHTHGTWVSGVVGAKGDNNVGTVGVAPESTLVGYYMRFGFGGSSLAEISNLLARQIDVDVSNNSWGYTTAFLDNFLDPIFAGMKAAITNAVAQGRDGLGTIYVFAAGNDREYEPNSLSHDGDNTNYHSLSNNRFTVTVAGNEQDGDVTSFSTPGASILVTAPAQWIATTTPNDGDGDLSDDFGFVSGTSFAAPIVSGVIALMLEANPDLGYRDVQEILALSARKLDPTSTSWAENGATNWNGGHNLVSHDFGFGLVDAHSAVRLAETWNSFHTAANEAVVSVVGSVDGNTALVDFQPNLYIATVADTYEDFSIDWVEVDVSLLHTHIGDLRIELVSPTGTHSVLMNRSMAGNNPKDNLTFTFSTTHDWAESPVGDWTLIVADEGYAGIGSMTSFALRFYGDDEGSDDTYYYTDEFTTLSGDRATLADTAGHDTINAAAVTSSLLLDLAPGATLTIAGRTITTGFDTRIENAYAGDADDTLIGNAADNTLRGGAGNDVLTGKAGNDTLAGGAGVDLFVYATGDGSDTILDFTVGDGDQIDLTGAHVATLGGLLARASQIGTDTVVDLGNGGLLTLIGVDSSDLVAEGFRFADDVAPTDLTLSNDVVLVEGQIGAVIGSLSVPDAILGEDFTYQLFDNYGGLFAIEGRNLVLAGSLNEARTYDIVIHASGTEGHTVDENFSINAMELDDFIASGLNGGHSYYGGTGGDIYYATNPDDIVLEAVGSGDDTIFAAVSYVLPDNIEALQLLEGAGAIDGAGNALGNTIIGNSDDNNIDGASGGDTMLGGGGNDRYFVDDVGDLVIENSNEGIDTVIAAINYTLGAEVDNLILVADSVMGTGNGLDNIITGNAADNALDGGAGADTMIGGAGNDAYTVDDARDLVIEEDDGGVDTVRSTASHTLAAEVENLVLAPEAGAIDGTGNAGDNTITGNAEANILVGGDGDDVLMGGGSADTMVGGDGDDSYWVEDAGDLIIEAAGEGIDTVHATISYTLAAGVENLILAPDAGAIDGTGNGLANTISGNAADNAIDGALGADFMAGGAGNDTYYVDNTDDEIIESPGEGVDTVVAATSFNLATDVENLILVAGATAGTGNTHANDIIGNAGNNILDGGAGADTLAGGAGDDIYHVDDAGDLVIEHAGEGIDTIITTISHVLEADVENLILAEGALDGTGNELDNTFIGSSSDNVIDGAGGIDTVDCSSATQAIVVDLSAGQANGAEIGHDQLLNIESIVAGSGNDTLTGNAVDNLLDGGVGADTMIGGGGWDHYIVDDAGDEVIENIDEGFDLVTAWIDYTLPEMVERLSLAEGAGNLRGIGNDADNYIIGNSGDNILDGMSGGDYLAGGAGNDVYFVENANDLVIENPDSGDDIVHAFVDYTAPDNVETVIMMGAARTLSFAQDSSGLVLNAADNAAVNPHIGYGNALDNEMVGSAGNDALFGGDGIDVLSGGAGDDTLSAHSIANLFIQEADNLFGGDGNDTIYGEAVDTIAGGDGIDVLQVINAYDMNLNLAVAGIEYVVSDFGNDTYEATSISVAVEVYGSGGDDIITGGSGDDRLWGGIDDDILAGGAGDDVLVGDIGADSLSGGDGNDRLYVDSSDAVIDAGGGFDAAYIIGGTGMTLDMAALRLEWVADFMNGDDVIDASGCVTGVEIYAAGGNDGVTGGAGNDRIFAGAGDDVLAGGGGSDALIGEAGADLFVYDAGGNTDTIYDWEDGIDHIEFRDIVGLDDFRDLTISESHGHSTISFGGEKLLVVLGAAGQLDSHDFLFI